MGVSFLGSSFYLILSVAARARFVTSREHEETDGPENRAGNKPMGDVASAGK